MRMKREPVQRKPRAAGGGPVGPVETHAKRDRGRARAQKRKQEEAERARGCAW
jgi:hypothetical protein